MYCVFHFIVTKLLKYSLWNNNLINLHQNVNLAKITEIIVFDIKNIPNIQMAS